MEVTVHVAIQKVLIPLNGQRSGVERLKNGQRSGVERLNNGQRSGIERLEEAQIPNSCLVESN
jgi:hypothetical protein